MPGVPPDALAQVKKGLRGLFNRKKSKGGNSQPQSDPNDPESTSRELPTDTEAAPATAARAVDDTKNGSPAHHISEPSGVEEAKAVDLNPTTTSDATKAVDLNPKRTTSDATTNTNTNTNTVAPAATEGTALVAATQGKQLAASSGIKAETETSTGMSATSGPLGDHMAEVYQDVGGHGEVEGHAQEEPVNDGD